MTKWGIDGIWLELKSKQNPGTGTSGSTSFSISLSELTGCKTSCILYIYLTFSLFKSFSSNTCIQYPWPPVWSIFHYLQRASRCWCTQHWPKWSFHFFFRPQWVKLKKTHVLELTDLENEQDSLPWFCLDQGGSRMFRKANYGIKSILKNNGNYSYILWF